MKLHAVGVGLIVVSLCVTGAGTASADAPVSLTYLAGYQLPDGTTAHGTPIGGLSGIDFDPSANSFLAISDDRGEKGPGRFYSLGLDSISAAGPIGTAIVGDAEPLAPKQFDMESIRAVPGTDNVLISSEGDPAEAAAPPWIREYNRGGQYVRDLSVPPAYAFGPGHGIRSNLGFEGLTVSPAGVTAITESALAQDGAVSSPGVPSRSRVLQLGSGGAVRGEFLYRVDGAPEGSAPKTSKGATEILAINDTDFYVIERSFDAATGNDVEIFWTTTNGATPVTGQDVADSAATPMPKQRVLDLNAVPGVVVDNIEGITFGPTLPTGQRSLVLVSDDNFSAPTQHTWFHLLAVD